MSFVTHFAFPNTYINFDICEQLRASPKTLFVIRRNEELKEPEKSREFFLPPSRSPDSIQTRKFVAGGESGGVGVSTLTSKSLVLSS